MTPDVVVDIGNTRMKWGRCYPDGIPGLVSLAPDSPENWNLQAAAWNLPRPAAWAIASVHPDRLRQFMKWATSRGDRVQVIEHAHIPIPIRVEEPQAVGIDRLLTALAAHRAARPRPVIAINIGTAVTCDLVDENGAFLGGAIFPGPQLMARSLHEHTAKLPLIEASNLHTVYPPGTDTRRAIELGIVSAVGGAITRLIEQYADYLDMPPVVFFTGGGMGPFSDVDDETWTPDSNDTRFVPTLTLEGIRIAGEGLP